MRFLSKKKVDIVVSILLIVSIVLLLAGLKFEGSASDTWFSPCRIENTPGPNEIIQVKDVMYYAYNGDIIRVFKSYDGCTWSEIESPVSGHDVWRRSIEIFKTPADQLAIVWQETDPDKSKKSRTAFFLSIFDGNTWSEPEIILHRDEYCSIEAAMALDGGSLLLLWSEDLVRYIEDGDRRIRAGGCDVTYRAYIGNDEVLIERVIEPENPALCHTSGFAFIDDGEYTWCVFQHGTRTYSFYRSWSKDGQTWSPPEMFHIPVSIISQVLKTPQGEIGILDFDLYERNLFLYRSRDWENWSKEKLITAGSGIHGAVITEGKNGIMWGFMRTAGNLYFIRPSDTSIQDYDEKMRIATVLGYLSLFFIVLVVLISLLRMWKSEFLKNLEKGIIERVWSET
ncbi:MAG: hypothetical protein PVF58_18825 [Candidatus Methanofastidiosia archaeon]|jgi:hypothetical protein